MIPRYASSRDNAIAMRDHSDAMLTRTSRMAQLFPDRKEALTRVFVFHANRMEALDSLIESTSTR